MCTSLSDVHTQFKKKQNRMNLSCGIQSMQSTSIGDAIYEAPDISCT